MSSYLKNFFDFTAPVASSQKNLYSQIASVLGTPPQGEGLLVSFKYNGFNKQWLAEAIKDPTNFPNAEINPDTDQGRHLFVIFRGEEAKKFQENLTAYKAADKANVR